MTDQRASITPGSPRDPSGRGDADDDRRPDDDRSPEAAELDEDRLEQLEEERATGEGMAEPPPEVLPRE